MKSSLTKFADWESPEFQDALRILGNLESKYGKHGRYHRKLWELASCLRCLRPVGGRGLVFGVGNEPLPAIFAAMGCMVLATDAPPNTPGHSAGWAETNQYATGLDNLRNPSVSDFNERVLFRYVDMNNIPTDLYGRFDFVWSICALEHLGSIEKGIRFLLDSTKCLKPGGRAFHTTEFNCSDEINTLDNNSSVFFRRSDIENLAFGLSVGGAKLSDRDYSIGNHPFDWQVARPPYTEDVHLKVESDGYVVTCIRLIIERD